MTRFVGLGRSEVELPGELERPEDYLADVLADVAALPTEDVPLDDCPGRVLAADVTATHPLPAFPNAAMDGYAVRAADVAGASMDAPVGLRVVGEVAAGSSADVEVRPGTAVRIMTGAPVPPGADAVVPVETTRAAEASVDVHHAVRPGQHVRHAGEDVAAGQLVLPAGGLVGPAGVAVAAAVGRHHLSCHRRARVTVVATGDELVPAGAALERGELHDSNGPMLLALARSEGAAADRVGPVRDDPEELRDVIAAAAARSDVVLTSGGVSAGAHDHLPEVLAALGSCRRAKLAMKPGKPQVLGRVGDCIVLGLPGNPVSSFVSFQLFALPLLRTLHGRTDVQRPVVVATAAHRLAGSPGKRTFLRVRLRAGDASLLAESAGGQGSHVISALTAADGLAELPEDVSGIAAGDPVRVRLLTDLPGSPRSGT